MLNTHSYFFCLHKLQTQITNNIHKKKYALNLSVLRILWKQMEILKELITL